jgi:hypothetical protein
MIVRHDFGARRQVTAASGHDDVLAAHAEALGGSFAEVEMRESRGLSPDPTRECVGHLVTLLAKRPDSYRSKSQRWINTGNVMRCTILTARFGVTPSTKSRKNRILLTY